MFPSARLQVHEESLRTLGAELMCVIDASK
jgi:hypothetical protein